MQEQVVHYLQGTKHVAFATVNEHGEPRVAPLDGVFIHGRFTVSTGGRAARLRHLRANAACSAAHMDGDTVGIVVHGHATIIGRDDDGVADDRAGVAGDLRLEPIRVGRGRRLHADRARRRCGRMPSIRRPSPSSRGACSPSSRSGYPRGSQPRRNEMAEQKLQGRRSRSSRPTWSSRSSSSSRARRSRTPARRPI